METLRIGGRRYSDPDIISLCRQSGELIDPRSTIVNMARALTEKANGFSGLPSDPLERLKIVASLSRMKILPMDMDQVRREKRDAHFIRLPTVGGRFFTTRIAPRLESFSRLATRLSTLSSPTAPMVLGSEQSRTPDREKRTNLNFCATWGLRS